MRFVPIGNTFISNTINTILPTEIITQFDASGTKLQSCGGFLKLLSVLEGKKEVLNHHLLMWSWSFWFEFDYDILETFAFKFDFTIYHLSTRKGPAGIITANLLVWKEFILFCEESIVPEIRSVGQSLKGYWDANGLPSSF